MTKGSDNNYPSVLLADQGSAPTTPAANHSRIFSKSDGLYIVDDAGGVTGPFISAAGGGYTQGARVYDSDGQTINNNSLTAIGFDSERYDTDTCHDPGANTKLTATTAGKYIIIGNVQWAANTSGQRVLAIRMDGATYIGTDHRTPGLNISYYQQVSAIWDMVATHYVELMCLHDISGGGTLNIEAGASYSPEFMMQRIG